ncbi:MAG: TonB-dependent receptor plug domain-containing protein [Thiobacillus sp.]
MPDVLYTVIRTVSACVAMWGVLAGAAEAQPALTEVDFLDELPVVLSASRLSQPVSEAPAAVTIIDQDMIRASGFRDIPDLLRLVPGFSVAYTRDNTWAAGYHGLADAYSRRFQVLVDGRSIYSPHYGAVNWTDLPLAVDDIERIEVVRGPDAAVYGANAFAAIINIITQAAAQVPGEFVSVQAGTHAMRGLTVRHGAGSDPLSYRLTVSAQHRDRFDRDVVAPPGSGIAGGQYLEANQTYFVNGRMDWQLAPDTNVMAQAGFALGDGRSGVLGNEDPRLALEPTRQDSRAFYVQVAYHKVESPQREWRVQAIHSRNRFDANARVSPLVYKGTDYGTVVVDEYLSQSRSSLDLQVNEQWTSNLRGVWGGEVWQETVRSPQNYSTPKTLRGELARAYGNLEWRAHERVLLHGGAMVEHHYFTGADVSPRLAASFTAAPGHVVRVGISRAYRSPTFFEEMGNEVLRLESGAPADIITVPSSGLLPERIVSREIAYVGQWQPQRLELDLRVYRDRIDNFIGLTRIIPNPPEDAGSFQPKVFHADNVGRIDAQGGEIQLRWRPTQAFEVSAHYARVFLETDTSQPAFNKDLPKSAPRNSGGLLARYRFDGGWEASLFAQRSDAMIWLSEGDTTRPFTRVDARLARRWAWQGTQIEAALVGQNLGRDYEEFRNTNIFSRRVYGSLSLAW